MTDHLATDDSAAEAIRRFIAGSLNITARARPTQPAARAIDPNRHDHPRVRLELPCRRHDPELWFAESPHDLERAKTLCATCPIRLACLATAIHHAEYAGVWGGHIFDRGKILPHKRGRGRPRKHHHPTPKPATMPTTMRATTATTSPDHIRAAADQLYNAECALHTAHQSRNDTWINAANNKLHDAVTNYITAIHTPPADRTRHAS